MFANTLRNKAARRQMATFALGAVAVLSACGATAADQGRTERADRVDLATQGQGSAGSFSLDYDTARHMGRLDANAGAFSLDYDTAKHMGRIDADVIAP